MRVLVTGGSGFIGGALCSALAQQGYSVRGIYRTGSVPSEPGIEWVRTPNLAGSNFSDLLDGCDYVVHLAALAHQINKQVAAGEFDRVNHQVTAELAHAVAHSPTVRRLVFVSSIGAVCSSSETAVTSQTEPSPDSEYGRSKRDAELAVGKILAQTRQDWCIVRPTLVYGPGNPGNMLRLMRLTRSPVPLPFRSIRNRRSFLYVENLVDLIEKALADPNASRQVFNVADSEVLSTAELVRLLARLSGRSIRLLPLPVWSLRAMARGGDLASKVLGRSFGLDSYSVDRLVSSLEVDTSFVRSQMRWQPPFTTEEGLRRTLSAKT